MEQSNTIIALNGLSAGTTQTSYPFLAEFYSSFTATVTVGHGTGIVGTLAVQGSAEQESPSVWAPVAGGTAYVVGNGTVNLGPVGLGYRWMRCVWTPTAGSGGLVTVRGVLDSAPVNTTTVQSVPVASGATPINAVRSAIVGQQDSGAYTESAFSPQGHLEVALHEPRLPFGSVHTESLRTIFQTDAVYGLNAGQTTTTTASGGTSTAANSAMTVATGTNSGAFATIQSRKRLRYLPGQGVIGRFASRFPANAASSVLVSGVGHAEDGLFVGYNGTSFGLLYSHHGVREVRTLTVSAGAGGGENVTVKLNGTDTVVPVVAGNTTSTAYQLSQATYAGWAAEQVGATVIFVRNSAGAASGTYSLTSTGTTAGTFAQTKAGAAATDTWIPQSSWNSDKLDGSGPSGVTLDPTKFNVYQVKIQYLGSGAVVLEVETCPTDGNNPVWTVAHTIQFPNTLTATSFGNPSFPFTMAAYSAGSTTDLSVQTGSFAGFIEGQKYLQGDRFTYFNTSTGVAANAYLPLFTVRNSRYFGGRTNQAVVNLISVQAAIKHTSPVSLYLIRNGTLAGVPSFAAYSSTSCTYWDTAATAVTFSNNNQVIWSSSLGDTGSIPPFSFGEELTIQPGETLTLAARAVTGTPAYVVGALNTREDS